MQRPVPLVLASLVALVMVTSYLPTAAAAAGGPVSGVPVPQSGGWSQMLPSFGPSTPGARDLGPLPSQPISVGLALPPQDPDGLSELIQEISTPGSPEYGHYLSPSEYQSQFSPSPAAVQAVADYYAPFGLTVQPSADRMIVQLTGTSGAVASAFHTSFDQFELSSGTQVYGPETPVSLPQALGITAVTGFTDTTGIKPFFTGPPILPPATSNDPSTPAACSPVSGNSPSELEGQYGESSVLSTDNGAGITVGIVDAYDSSFTQADASSTLTSFASGCGLTTPHINFLYPVRTSANLNSSASTGWGGETELDIETVDSMAPGATIDLALASDSSLAVYESVDYLVEYNLTQTISESWGEPDSGTGHEAPTNPCLPYYSCNASWDGSYGFLHPIYAEAVAEGITPFGAAGDCGAYDSTGILTTDYPGSDPYVVSVGGTVLNSTGTTYGGESGWSGTGKDCTANTGGGGGGYAPFPRPWYQSGEGLSTTNDRRGAPDVSASSADGTSEATPIWAGLIGVADEVHGDTGLGLIGPSMYAILRTPTEYAADFHDIVVGNNGYPAGRGWDPVTGIGSPDAAGLIPDLVRHQVAPVSNLTVSLTASPGNTAAETFTAVAHGGVPPYHYDFIPGLDLGQWSGTNASIPYTYKGTGAYFATVQVWDSTGNWTESLPVLVDIGTSTLGGTLTPSSTSVTVGASVSFTTAPTGGTSPYSYDYLWGDGSYGYNGTATEAHTFQAVGTYCPSVEIMDSAAPVDGFLAASPCIAVGGGAPLSAYLNAAPSTGSPPLSVAFTSQVVGGVPSDSYSWSYGDGSPLSGAADPTHVYNASGTYPVVLAVSDSGGHLAHAFTNITVSGTSSPLSVTITATPSSGAPPLAVSFTSSPTGGTGSYSYAWTFGDGGTSTLANPSHTYTAAGTYPVVLTVTSGSRVAHAYTNVTASSLPTLVVSASAGPQKGIAPQSVLFNGSASGGEPGYTWSWNFGDGSALSAQRNPIHDYTSPGTYTAVLTVTDQQPVSSQASVSVQVAAQVAGSASAAPQDGVAPLSVTFNATATGGWPAYSWAWRFGDGTTSSLENPTHSYANAGTYTARVWVNDTTTGTWTSTVPITVTSATPLAIVSGGLHDATVGTASDFWASATGGVAPYSFSWNFGDGSSVLNTGATNQSQHTYAAAGTYVLDVTVTDSTSATASTTPFLVYATAGTPLSVRIGGTVGLPVNQTASFWAAAAGGAGGFTYTWTFGDGTSSSASSSNTTTHVFQNAGKFDVSVTVKDASGEQLSSNVLVVTVTPVSTTANPNSNPLLSNGSLSPLGWVLVGLVVSIVAISAVMYARRKREPRDGYYDPEPATGWAPPPPQPPTG